MKLRIPPLFRQVFAENSCCKAKALAWATGSRYGSEKGDLLSRPSPQKRGKKCTRTDFSGSSWSRPLLVRAVRMFWTTRQQDPQQPAPLLAQARPFLRMVTRFRVPSLVARLAGCSAGCADTDTLLSNLAYRADRRGAFPFPLDLGPHRVRAVRSLFLCLTVARPGQRSFQFNPVSREISCSQSFART